ncbi:hypothetical protein KO507_06755 [Gilvimarinus agarilyticus]|uniref:DUF6463 family protein n=1 Tax=Gilvimarinus sp. 2_MG-2023 TaxID=3062666 RepID=UPI001C092B80|nr:DUF6463 family protein [Gilvimarinus sp. 2_MG-2023]MBU2885457.1 hypothetical protein [Gilvimarinus agarilyticus]MDO6570357.1 DUF6463 family protein [Gilvimarinus sp. 2_MG-2023]
MKVAQYSGWYLLATGIIHNTIGLVMGWPILKGIHSAGWWNAVERGGEIDFARSAIVWFLVLGFFWMLMGYLMQQWLKQIRRPLPIAMGWGMVLIGAWVALMLPASGAWLVIVQGLIVLLDRREA